MLDSLPVIYLDNNATTKVAPSVFEAMTPFLTEYYGNPSSIYAIGADAAKALTQAREQVANLLHCEAKEIIFTSCGTESDNTAIESALRTTRKRHVVTTQVEHSAVRNYCEHLESRNVAVTYIPVNSDGTLEIKEIERAIRADTAIVSIMWANNETGVLFPVEEIAEICKTKGVLFHTDAVQAVGKIPINLQKNKIDFLSLSGHKIHASKGVGALFVRSGVRFSPYLIGGGQEHGKRGGTENVASIVGFGRAAVLAEANLQDEQIRIKALRDRLESGILQSIPCARLNGHPSSRLPNTTHISFEGIEARNILLMLDQHGICCSAGSACTTGSLEPSHVLRAMGISSSLARSAIRFSLGVYNQEHEINRVLDILPKIISQLQETRPQTTVL